MKKTLITLLALSGLAIADTVTYSSYTSSFAITSSFVGKTADQIRALGATDANKLAFTDNQTVSLSVAGMMPSDVLESDTELMLNTFSYISRPDTTHTSENSTVSITLDGVTYTSGAAVYTGTDGTYGLISYTFTDGPTFTAADTLSFSIARVGTTDPSKLAFGAFQGLEGTTKIYGDWQGAFQISGTIATAAVPEPTTATLSLLALAGLAARRRRK